MKYSEKISTKRVQEKNLEKVSLLHTFILKVEHFIRMIIF